jgi:hypothetical protein
MWAGMQSVKSVKGGRQGPVNGKKRHTRGRKA